MGFSAGKYIDLLKQNEIELARDYRTFFTPDYLYKFYWLNEINDEKLEEHLVESNNQKFETLEKNQLWFALPAFQNDPYEFKGMYLDKEKLASCGVKIKDIEDVENWIQNVPICCFVGNSSSNLAMWAHYANNHKGYCVKYKVNNKKEIRSVLYEPKRVAVATIFLNFLEDGENLWDRLGRDDELNIYKEILLERLFIKHDSWSGEKEFRIVNLAEKPIEKGQYVDVAAVGLETMEIICGYQCSEEHVERLTGIADALEIPCRKCALSETEFTVYNELQLSNSRVLLK